MKIAIIGPGGIGCLFATLLTEGGHDVCLIDRRPDRATLIAVEGVVIEKNGDLRRIPLRANAHPTDIGNVELIILCVKAHETAGTARSIMALAGPQTGVLSMQNGLGNMEVISRIVGSKNVFAGVTTQGATVIGLNHIRHAGAGLTMIGSIDHSNSSANKLAKMLTLAGIKSESVSDTPALLWSKLVTNAAICPVSALSGLTNGQIASDEKWRSLLCRAAEEGAKVAAAKGIKLMHADPARAALEVCNNTAGNISSMLQDIRRGRKTEIMMINGAIVRAASEVGIEVPTNEMLCQNVIAMEQHLN